MKIELDLTNLANPGGLILSLDGQRFTAIRAEAHQRADGTPTKLIIWHTTCAVCGAHVLHPQPGARVLDAPSPVPGSQSPRPPGGQGREGGCGRRMSQDPSLRLGQDPSLRLGQDPSLRLGQDLRERILTLQADCLRKLEVGDGVDSGLLQLAANATIVLLALDNEIPVYRPVQNVLKD